MSHEPLLEENAVRARALEVLDVVIERDRLRKDAVELRVSLVIMFCLVMFVSAVALYNRQSRARFGECPN